MNLSLALLMAALAAPVFAAVGVRGATLTPPPDAPMTADHERGVSMLSVQVSSNSRVDVVSYDWWGNKLSGGPTDAHAFLALVQDAGGFDQFRLTSPLVETNHQGAPAWSFTRAFQFGMPLRGVPVKQFKEEYLVIQRRWGFVALQFMSTPRAFDRDRPLFLAVRDSLKLEPELPGGPVVTPVLAAVFILAVAGYAWRRRRA